MTTFVQQPDVPLSTFAPWGDELYSKGATSKPVEMLAGGTVGTQREDKLFSLRTGHGWTGFPHCTPHSGGESGSWQTSSGWAVVTARKTDDNVSSGNVREPVRVSGGAPFPSTISVNNQFELLIRLADALKKPDAVKEIRATRDAWLRARQGISEHNRILGEVWASAHGNCGDKKDGWAQGTYYATIRYVGDEDDLNKTIATLRDKWGL